jgi:hypothetical protein
MAKRKVESQIANLIHLTFDHWKSRIDPSSLHAGSMQHIVGKILTKATTLFQTSSQLKVWTQSYGALKSRESQLWEFRDSHLGVPKQNAIWMWASWRGTKYTIRGKVVTSPKFGPWWILWIRICSWLILTPKLFQLCTNQLVVWFCPCEWISCLSFFLVPSRSSSTPLYPQNVMSQKMCFRFVALSLFSFQIHIWVYQRAWGRISCGLCFLLEKIFNHMNGTNIL